MRTALVIALLLAPLASASHGYDVGNGVVDGAKLLLTWTAEGSATATGHAKLGEGHTEDRSMSFSYQWEATASLIHQQGAFRGQASASGGGSGSATHISTFVTDGSIVKSTIHCDLERTLGQHNIFAVLDPETQTLVVHMQGTGGSKEGEDCEAEEEVANPYPYPSVAPLLGHTERNLARYGRLLGAVSGGEAWDRENVLAGLTFEIPLDGRSWSKRDLIDVTEFTSDDAAAFSCAAPLQTPTDRCVVRSQIHVHSLLDPCALAGVSAKVHLAELLAVVAPSGNVSESQARAFQVDVGQKMRALLSDERTLALFGCDGTPGAMEAISDAVQKVLDTWIKAARSGPISDEGKRDILGIERQSQLMGGEASAEVGAIVESLQAGPGAPIRFRTHSPVSIHAWDAEGRHVGWNVDDDSAEIEIPGAIYEGRPGEAQNITLPAGAYRVAAIPTSPGLFTLNLSAGEGEPERFPLEAVPGRVVTLNALGDEQGLFLGYAALVREDADLPFHVSPTLGAFSGGGSETGGASGGNEETDAPTPATNVPALGATGALLLCVAIALLMGRR